ncbi:o-succinylbenzoate synthase [Reichenbachiella carrageenanivorans]|uniref:O-succinylbenzoate synthase n=1 Tax=Reichenbachiella carrageenanivorans TaxID=2979869 RepID=A0ABY6D4W1_9BACT|nr:o-succinylbenzoate synthase [Reichenbachiella carrageenanivorans]UXX81196.1 o-succinylbenzoate synthase [Reichenbachiella carrageenanivorans]
MGLILEYTKHELNFKFDAGTSRGVLKTKEAWILKIHQQGKPKTFGLGEVSTIERLSFDYSVDFESELDELKGTLLGVELPVTVPEIYKLVNKQVSKYRPAIRFGLETALLDLFHGGQFQLFDNDFYYGRSGIPINGLIWMGEKAFMKSQIDEKLRLGFKCIKLKIGAIDFDAECELLDYIRSQYPADQLILRVDANGAFITQEVLKKLERLAVFDLHSIEQPIMPRQPEAMSLVCEKSQVPIALDEELIGVFDKYEKIALVEDIKPDYVILKPSLLGGFAATAEWIEIAKAHQIGWWITSALESNIGLNAICQFTAAYDYVGHQGLGTGQLFDNNIHSPLAIQGEEVVYNQTLSWDLGTLKFN